MDRKLALTIQFNALDKLSGSMKKIVGLGEKGHTALARMKRTSRDLNKQLSDVRRQINSGAGQAGGLVDQEQKLTKALAANNRELAKRGRFMAIDNKANKMQAQGRRYQAAGRGNMVGGGGLLATLAWPVKSGMEFSSGMVDLQQKANLTSAEMGKMKNTIRLAAKATHQMPAAMLGAVDTMAGLGMATADAVRLAGPVGKLGTAFKVDLTDGAASADAMMRSLGLTVEQIPKAFDAMAASGNRGAFEIKDMSRHFPALLAQAKSLGQQGPAAVADISAALQVARMGTGTSDEAATNIASLMRKIHTPETYRKFQKNFGIDLPKMLADLEKKGVPPLEAIALATREAVGDDDKKLGFLFQNSQSQSAVRMLMQNMDDYRSIRKDALGAIGTVDGAFNQRELSDGMVMWNSFTGILGDFGLVIGGSLLPVASQFFAILGPMVATIGDFAADNPKLTTTLLTMVAGLGMAKLGVGALQFAWGSSLGPLAKAWKAYSKFKGAGTIASQFPKAAKLFGALRTAVLFLAKGFRTAGLIMLASPIGIIIGIVVAVVAGAAYIIYKNWDVISAAFSKGVANLKALLGAIPAWMKNIGQMMMEGLLMSINPMALAKKLISVARYGISAFKDYLGIKSPSRLFMAMGGHITTGLAQGVDKTARKPIRSIGKMATGLAGAMALGASPALANGGAAGGGGAGGVNITINITQAAGEDGEALAKRVAAQIKRMMDSDARGSYRDA